VEDNESIKQMLVSIFETFYQVTTASDGEEALEKVREEMPSVVQMAFNNSHSTVQHFLIHRVGGQHLCESLRLLAEFFL